MRATCFSAPLSSASLSERKRWRAWLFSRISDMNHLQSENACIITELAGAREKELEECIGEKGQVAVKKCGLLAFAKIVINQFGQGLNRSSLIGPIGHQFPFGTFAGGEHHHLHDIFCVHLAAFP